jgi:Membrane proteins related to metalloendopeptidases
MTLDYIPAERVRSSAARRVAILASVVCVSAGAITLMHRPVSLPGASSQTLLSASALQPLPQHYNDIVKAAVDDALKLPDHSDWQVLTVKKGETLSTIFDQLGLPSSDWMNIVALGGNAAKLKQLDVGDHLRVMVGPEHLEELTYPIDSTHTLDVRRENGAYQARTLTASLTHQREVASGTITDSLFVDGQKAGLSDRQILQFADIFGYDVDFAQDLQQGDRFTVIYNEDLRNGQKVRRGSIVAAEFVNQGHVFRAVRFTMPNGDTAYYTPSGQSMRKAFLRTPVDFTRISSGFSKARMNPILHIVRPHWGTDYAAPMGTPIKATSDGHVVFRGWESGYGRVVKIKLGHKYETVYGHMSKFRKGVVAGSHVHQGQVIGYVGMSGLATGPHLHYEFRVNGVPKNPVTVALPRANPVPHRLMARFRAQTSQLVARLKRAGTRRFARAAATTDTSAIGSP